ncbi:MAG: 6-hydroxycyclohex-1-ene-1-carbonyl-CoA dehydrogenase [Deltaproteobacteria bacterium]|nr:6-hydroxycyclohex-1-ene-1-carbonyl-CoA dehydrogenase [Deltaproteobacteria bacterium]
MFVIEAWQMDRHGAPLVHRDLPLPELRRGEALISVAGCGLSHTDLAMLDGQLNPVSELPLTLGHAISGRVVQAPGNEQLIGKDVIVPAVLPCGRCELCRSGHGTACRRHRMHGRHLPGGFASHVVTSARYLCPANVTASDQELWELSVVAEAVATPYSAMRRAAVGEGDVVIVVGVGALGIYGVQIAGALGAHVIAIDVDPKRLERLRRYGAYASIDARGKSPEQIREAIRALTRTLGLPVDRWKVFEMSGTRAGQQTAYKLLTRGGTLFVVGYSLQTSDLPLGQLIALDATLYGNRGCHPDYYPEALELVLTGYVQLKPFIEGYALNEINAVVEKARAHQLKRCAILVPTPA